MNTAKNAPRWSRTLALVATFAGLLTAMNPPGAGAADNSPPDPAAAIGPLVGMPPIYLTNYHSQMSCGRGWVFGSGTWANPYWGDFDAIMDNCTSPWHTIV